MKYNEYECWITIEDGIITGKLPRRALRLVYEWLDLHKDELMDNWNRLQNSETPHKIVPSKIEADMDANLFSNNCTTKTISGINNKNSNTSVPTTQRVRRSYYVYPASYSYYADEKIYDPKVLKVKLEEVSKKYPKDVIKTKDLKQFIKSLGL